MANPESKGPSLKRTKLGPLAVTFLVSYCLWLVLSGKFDHFHMTLGLISCVIVSLFSSDLLFPDGLPAHFLSKALGFIAYLPWLIYQIFLANLHVLYLSVHPKMLDKINPQIIRFETKLRSDFSIVAFANSITLTPGTITLFVSVDGDFKVHAIDNKSAEGLPGQMEERIARALKEN